MQAESLPLVQLGLLRALRLVLEAKLASASALYGILGLVTTALFYLFLVGRGVVRAAELNAVIWEASASRRD